MLKKSKKSTETEFVNSLLDDVFGNALNFALIQTETTIELVPIQNCELYSKSPYEALYQLSQQPHSIAPPIKRVLRHPQNTLILEDDFLNFLCSKDEQGKARMLQLNAPSTLEALELIQEKKFPLDFLEDITDGNTLFTYWVKRGKLAIAKRILELSPKAIEQIHGNSDVSIPAIALRGHKEMTALLLDAQGNKLSSEEKWIECIVKNGDFPKEEFKKLEKSLQKKLYFIANLFSQEKVILQMNSCGMLEKPIFPLGPSLIAYNMDFIQVRSTLEEFLRNLRRKKFLLTEQEFKSLDSTQYHKKANQISRILGRDFVERVAKDNGLKYIKVPEKIAVIDEGRATVSFRFKDLELLVNRKPSFNNPYEISIYAKHIKVKEGYCPLEWAIECMIALEKTGYNDFIGYNFILAEDGIYFIDTEFENFSPTNPSFEGIQSISQLLDPKDVDAFMKIFEERKKSYAKPKGSAEFYLPENRYLVDASTYKSFEFSVESLLKS